LGYRITNAAVPEDFISQKDFLINLIPKAMEYFINNTENLSISFVDITNINFSIGCAKKRMGGWFGPERYPPAFSLF
jgi:hypothetical protein